MENTKLNKKSAIGQILADGITMMVEEISWGGAITYFYNTSVGLSMKYIAIILVIFAVWNAVDNIIIGYISDYFKSKGVKRSKFIRAVAPIITIFFSLAFIRVPFITSQLEMAIFLFIIMCILDIGVAFLEVNLFAIPVQETLEDHKRGTIYLIEGVVDMAVLIVPLYVIPTLRPSKNESSMMFSMIMCGIGIISGIILFIASYMIDEKDYPDNEHLKIDNFFEVAKGFFTSKSFWVGELESIAYIITYGIYSLGMYYYFDECESNQIACYIALVVGLLTMILIYKFFFDQIGTKMLNFISVAVCALFMLLGYICGPTTIAGILAFFGVGVGFAGNQFLLTLLMSDIADEYAYKHHVRNEGVYYGIDCFLASLANSTQSLFLVVLLSLGYVEGLEAGMQSVSAQEGIMTAWLLIPIIVLLIPTIGLLYFYPLNKKEVAHIKEELSKRENIND